MLLHFATSDMLRLALTAAAVPPALAMSRAVAGFDAQGGIWLRPAHDPPKAALAELRRLGVQSAQDTEVSLAEEVCCWPQLLALERVEAAPPSAQTAILFDLPASRLAELAGEILRLGNDRQGFRWLSEDRALLRVIGPPYYSLLRALDRVDAEAPRAYAEAAPHVWMEVGYRHSLAEQLKPPRGKLLLMRPPREWLFLDEAPFRDVYEILEFALPDEPVRWSPAELNQRLTVPLRLKQGGPVEAAELWVLHDRAMEQLDALVANADDLLLRQLSFAVADRGGERVIALRVRPSRQAPPVLVLEGVGFRSYLKLPNLFLPCGWRLHPPLRRDTVRQLLADDLASLTWLYPGADGRFQPEGLPEEAFRPLAEWVDYVLDHDRRDLQLWVESAQFDFEPFICADEASPPAPPKPRASQERRKTTPRLERAAEPKTTHPAKATEKPSPKVEDDDFAEPAQFEPSELQKQLQELEGKFLAEQGPLDSPARLALWPKLATVNTRLGNGDEAALCWLNVLWDAAAPSPRWLRGWLQAEASRVPLDLETGRAWVSRLAQGEEAGGDLDGLLAMDEPTPADVSALAAYLAWSAEQDTPPATLVERLDRVQQYLERYEEVLPVRTTWLAWLAIVRLAGGDVLALARARDRLLERLLQQGLQPEEDMPGFLRHAGQPAGQRFQAFRDWLLQLHRLAQRWVKHNGSPNPDSRTASYVDLLFAFGMVRAGEPQTARALLRRAREQLAEADEVHSFLFQAYDYRIRQALDGKPHAGPLPREQMEYLEQMERTSRYVVDRLRGHSRILEPELKIDAYRHARKALNELETVAADLPDILDRKQLAERITRLLRDSSDKRYGPEAREQVLRAALAQAPRAGETFALELVAQVPAAYDALPATRELAALNNRAELLEKALFVAAHFDDAERVQQLINRFERLLHEDHGPERIKAIDTLAGQSLRGLRKMGMRDEIDRLLYQMAEVILEGQPLKAVTPERLAGNWAGLRALLHVASGWYYFGRDRPAETVIQLARRVLLEEVTPQEELLKTGVETQERTKLACTYAAALSQAPPETARKRFEELFLKLEGIRDAFTTHLYFGRLQLEIVEAVVLAVVSEDLALGTHVRRWLDEDEFLVRRRIHRDLRELMAIG